MRVLSGIYTDGQTVFYASFSAPITSTMVLKLYGSLDTTCSQRVAIILAEKQVPYELVKISIAKGEHKSAEYLQKQPFGQLPYIVSI
jgi:glutaredoxin